MDFSTMTAKDITFQIERRLPHQIERICVRSRDRCLTDLEQQDAHALVEQLKSCREELMRRGLDPWD